MVKRKVLILLLLVSIISISFGLTPRVVDELEILEADEIDQIEDFMDGLEQIFDIETAAFFLADDQAVDTIAEDYSFTNPRKVIFAYSDESSTYRVFTTDIDEFDDENLSTILDELVDEDHTQALALLNSFYFKIYERLLPSLGGASVDIFDDFEDEDFEEEDYDEEDYYNQLALVFQSSDYWTEEEEEKLQARAEELAQIHDIFIAIVFMDEDLEMGSSDYIDAVLDEFTDLEDSIGLAVDFHGGSIGMAAGGRLQDILEEANKEKIFDSVNDALAEVGDYQAALNFLDGVQAFLEPQGGVVPLDTGAVLASDLVYIEDAAGLWTLEEREKLLEMAQELGEKHGLFVALATTDDSKGKTSEAYIDDMADEKFGINTDNVAFLIDMQNRRIHISTSGVAIEVLTDAKIDKMLDNIFKEVSNEKYFRAAEVFMRDVDKNFEKAGPNKVSSTDALAGLGLGGAGGLGFFTNTRKKYEKKAKPKSFQYMNNLVGGLAPARGALLNKRVTTRTLPKPSKSSSGGGSSTHTSSGGGTHGGGGRSF